MKIDISKEYFANMIEGQSTIIDIDAVLTVNKIPYLIDYKKIESTKATPWTAHPHKVPYKWRSLVRQINIAKRLNGRLAIIEWAENSDEIRVLIVDDYYKERLEPYQYLSHEEFKKVCPYLEYLHIIKDTKLTTKQFKQYLNKVNKDTLNSINLLEGEI